MTTKPEQPKHRTHSNENIQHIKRGPNKQHNKKKHAKIYERQTRFSRLLWHPARKPSRSSLTTLEPGRGKGRRL